MGRENQPKAMALSKGISHYLDEVARGVGNDGRVALGAIGGGLPAFTTNPADVEHAIVVLREQSRKGTAVVRLKRQQRIISLTRALETMRQPPDESARKFFVAHALEWAQANGVGYSAFRAMGVSPEVLNDAGITRGMEP
jgi:hypothetical protein